MNFEKMNTAKTARIIKQFRKIYPAVLLCIMASILCQSNCAAEIKLTLRDEFLQKQCDWAMYLDVQDIDQTLNYKGSKLHPLSRVRVSYRAFPRSGSAPAKDSDSKTYEELWYYHRSPVGLRRFSQLDLSASSLGMIVLGSPDASSDHCAALTNTLVRLMIDLQFKDAPTSIVLVSENSYDQVASMLNYYHFYSGLKVKEGKQMSIHLCSNSSSKEGYFYLGK